MAENMALNEKATNGDGSRQMRLVMQPDWMSLESYSLLLMGISTVFYSFMAAYVKLAASTGIPSNELVFIRAISQGILVVLAMVWYKDYKEDGSSSRLIFVPFGDDRIRNLVIARGIMGGMGFCLYYYTISVLPLGDAVTLLSLNPIMTIFAGAVFLNEPIHRSHLFAAVSSLVGCVLISRPAFLFGRMEQQDDNTQHKYPSAGYMSALLGACCAAAVFILMRRAGKVGVHTLQLLFAWSTFGTLDSFGAGILLPLLRDGESSFAWPSTAMSWYYVVGSCVFGTMGHFLLNYAGRHAAAGLMSVVRSSGIMWSYAFEVVVFHQVPQQLTVCGVGLIVFSLVMVAYEKQQEEQRLQESTSTCRRQENAPLLRGEVHYGGIDDEEQQSAIKN